MLDLYKAAGSSRLAALIATLGMEPETRRRMDYGLQAASTDARSVWKRTPEGDLQ